MLKFLVKTGINRIVYTCMEEVFKGFREGSVPNSKQQGEN